jgi:hypothetical protein
MPLLRTKFVEELSNQHYVSAGEAALQMSKREPMWMDIKNRPRQGFWYRVKNGVAKVT